MTASNRLCDYTTGKGRKTRVILEPFNNSPLVLLELRGTRRGTVGVILDEDAAGALLDGLEQFLYEQVPTLNGDEDNECS